MQIDNAADPLTVPVYTVQFPPPLFSISVASSLLLATMKNSFLLLLSTLSLYLCGDLTSLDAHALMYRNISACFLIPVQVLPEGIEAVNGSSTDMGCTSALVDSGDVMTCNSQSYLVDGCSPDIDTSTSDWASQLVTVRSNEGTAAIPFAHVLLTFGFETNVFLTGIEMDLFHCPDWGIGAPRITVSLNEEYDFVFNLSLPFTPPVQPSQSSCDSLTTVHLSGDTLSVSSYRTFHILVDLSHQSSIEWVHIGDVRFFGEGGGPVQGTCPPPIPNAHVVCTTATVFNSARTNGIHLLAIIVHDAFPHYSSIPNAFEHQQHCCYHRGGVKNNWHVFKNNKK